MDLLKNTESIKVIITSIIIPLIYEIVKHMPITCRKKIQDDEVLRKEKLYLNYFTPIIILLVIHILISINNKRYHVGTFIINSIIIIVMFIVDYIICKFKINFKNLKDYKNFFHVGHIINVFMYNYSVIFRNNLIIIFEIITIVLVIRYIIYSIDKFNQSYRNISKIIIELEDSEKVIECMDYEQIKKSLRIYNKTSDNKIIVTTMYGVKIKKKTEIYE